MTEQEAFQLLEKAGGITQAAKLYPNIPTEHVLKYLYTVKSYLLEDEFDKNHWEDLIQHEFGK